MKLPRLASIVKSDWWIRPKLLEDADFSKRRSYTIL